MKNLKDFAKNYLNFLESNLSVKDTFNKTGYRHH